MDNHIPITKTGLISTLGGYAKTGELFLTTQITGAEADQIKETMRAWGAAAFKAHMQRWAARDEGDGPPILMEPLPTDVVWGFTTSSESWQHLAGRAGYALVRDGVVICDTIAAMS